MITIIKPMPPIELIFSCIAYTVTFCNMIYHHQIFPAYSKCCIFCTIYLFHT